MSASVSDTYGSAHLPECWASEPTDPEAWCICDELRACERRAARNGVEITYVWDQSEVDGLRADGYAAALNAAEQAVLALPTDLALSNQDTVVNRADVFEAIWKLKEKP